MFLFFLDIQRHIGLMCQRHITHDMQDFGDTPAARQVGTAPDMRHIQRHMRHTLDRRIHPFSTPPARLLNDRPI